MADGVQVERLRRSVAEWNAWREEEVDSTPDLESAELSDLDLAGADLSSGALTRADLMGSDLTGADLRRASLVGAYLLGSDLSEARLGRADLRGADLRGARLDGADLREALFLTQSQLESASGSVSTRLSAPLRRPRHWSDDGET